MTRAAYTGHEALTFSDYTDLETGKTLHAEPGRSYDVAPASGRAVPEFPEPWFVPVDPEAWAAAQAAREAERLAAEGEPAEGEGDPEADPDAGPAPEDEHNPDEG